MTAKERDRLDQLCDTLHSYHAAVQSHIARCESCNKDVDRHNTDLYGNPEDREGNPGLMAVVADLQKSRKILLGVAAGAWTVATLVIGAVVSHYV